MTGAVLGWYLASQAIGLLALPVVWTHFRNLPDRGYFVHKTLGLLIVGYTFWLGNALGVLSNDTGGVIVALGPGAMLSAYAARSALRRRDGGMPPLLAWMWRQRRIVLAAEGAYLLVFAGWCWIRAHDPAINHTEQPMDLMFLSATIGSSVPPPDPWLSGYAVSYYYFGYWLQGTLAQIAGETPEYAYNLAQASWLGLLWIGTAGLLFNLATLGSDGSWRSRRRALLLGGAGAITVAAMSNLHGTYSTLARWLANDQEGVIGDWWWWASSRVVRDVGLRGESIEIINEFPAFSFVLGDNHPHLLALPLLATVVYLALALFLEPPGIPRGGSLEAAQRRIGWLIGWLVVGACLAVNTWDLPAVGLLLVAAYALPRAARWRSRSTAALRVLRFAGLLGVGSLTLYAPYLLSAQSQQRGLLPNLFHPTELKHLLMTMGHLLPGLLALLVLCWRSFGRGAWRPWIVLAALAAPAASILPGVVWTSWTSPGRHWLGGFELVRPFAESLDRWLRQPYSAQLLLLLLLCTLVLLVRWSPKPPARASPRRHAEGFALLLAALGVVLLLIPELAYVRDVFETRMNTIFKLHYQAWFYLSIAAVWAAGRALKRGPLPRSLAWLSLVFLVAGLAYPSAALLTKLADANHELPTLDGLAYARSAAPDEVAAIAWIRAQTPRDAVILEAPGDSYRPEHNRVSAATGRPTLLGWQGHEAQWRGSAYAEMVSGRLETITLLYQTGTAQEIAAALERFDIDYLYLGPRERLVYGIDAARETLLLEAAPPVFQSGSVRILSGRETRIPPRTAPRNR